MAADEGQSLEVVRKSYPEQIVPVRPASPSPRNDEPRSAHLREYFNIVLARRTTFAAVFLTVLVMGVIQTYRQTRVYRATVSIQIDREDSRILTFDSISPGTRGDDDSLQTQFRILASETLARKVVEDLHLDREFDRIDKARARTVQPTRFVSLALGNIRRAVARLISGSPAETAVSETVSEDEDPLRSYVNGYLGSLFITPIVRTRLVNVGFESTDARLAAQVANAHAEHFIEQNLQFKWDATQVASDFLRKELTTLRANLEKAEDNLQAYSQVHQIFVVEDGQGTGSRNTETERLTDLQEAYTKAQTERIEKESAARLAKESSANLLDSDSSVIGSLNAQLVELQRLDAALAARFQPDFGPRKEIQNQIVAVSKAIETEKADRVKRAEDEYLTALDREQAFARELEKQGERVNRMKQENVQYGILKREADSNRQLYDALLLRLKEAGVSSSLKASNIRIVDRARVPVNPIRPDKKRGVMNVLILSIALGLGFVFFQEYMDSSVKSPDDVTRHTKLPTLGLIPRLHKAGIREAGKFVNFNIAIQRKKTDKDPQPAESSAIELISHSAPASLLAEAYRSLRASLILSSPNHPPRTILVTSAVPGEGKTATASNIAISLTQTGARVLLIDADMRRPRMDSLFDVRNKPGLSNFLTGVEQMQSVIHRTQVADLYLIPCGAIPPNPGELILSGRFREMLDNLRNLFNYVIIDSPPLTNVSDGRIISTSVEGVVFVIRALSTSRHAALRSLDQLEKTHSRVLGVVLNDYDIQNKGNYYYPYYKQAYSTGIEYRTHGKAGTSR